MTTKELFLKGILVFALTFIVTMIVTLLWNVFIGKIGAIIDWKTSFIFSIIFGLVIPIARSTEKVK